MILRLLTRVLACLALIALSANAHAHDLRFAKVDVVFDGDRFEATVRYDLDALLLAKDPGHLEAEDWAALEQLTPEQVLERLAPFAEQTQRKIEMRFDGKPADYEVSFPDYPEGRLSTRAARLDYSPTNPPRRILIAGAIPEGASTFTWLAREMGNSAVSIQRAGDEESGMHEALMPDTESSVYRLVGPQDKKSTAAVLAQYFVLGYTHILPDGLDHILFVLGLFLLSQKLGALLWQTTAFTIAHSITLIAAMYDMMSAPAYLVETFVALSIAYVAIENLFTRELHWWRPVVIFAFGLLHGLTFAGSLKEIGLPQDALLASLLSFNVGVELGQISVIALAFLAVGWWREREWYHLRIVTPASLAIACVAIVWAFQKFTDGVMS